MFKNQINPCSVLHNLKENMNFELQGLINWPCGHCDRYGWRVTAVCQKDLILLPLLKILTYSFVRKQGNIQRGSYYTTLKSPLHHIKRSAETGNDPW